MSENLKAKPLAKKLALLGLIVFFVSVLLLSFAFYHEDDLGSWYEVLESILVINVGLSFFLWCISSYLARGDGERVDLDFVMLISFCAGVYAIIAGFTSLAEQL